MPLTDLQIATLVERYAREQDRFEKMASTVARHISTRLRRATIPHVPTFRSKDPESFGGKLSRDRKKHDFVAFEREFAPAVLDLAGVRIMLYRPNDVAATCATIEDLFVVPPEERYRKDHTSPDGYQARHRVITLRDEQIENDPALANLRDVPCEVQVVTIGDHIWNELEHDIIYKTPNGKPTAVQDTLLETLRTQLNGVGDSVKRLMDATDKQREENDAPIESPEDLRHGLRTRSGVALVGDFDRLLQLLSAVLREVTPAVLHKLPLGSSELTSAGALLTSAGSQVVANDLALVVAALWPQYGADFLEVVKSWRGKPGPLSRIVRALDKATLEGKI